MEPIRILLVEDNPADAELAQEKMKEAKMLNSLSVVSDGESALDFLFRRGEYGSAPRPDLILLDLNLPGKNGMEVLDEIKRDTQLRSIPVVVLTSSDSDEDVIRSYDLQASSYVRKPVDLHGYTRIAQAIDVFWLGVVKYAPGTVPTAAAETAAGR